jgi:hypothetical protein
VFSFFVYTKYKVFYQCPNRFLFPELFSKESELRVYGLIADQ